MKIKPIPVSIVVYTAVSAVFLFWGFNTFVLVRTPESAELSDFKFASFEQDLPTGELRISEGLLEIYLGQAGIDAIADPSVDIKKDQIEIRSRDERGKDSVQVSVTPTVTDGNLRLDITSVTYKGFRAPRILTGAITGVINGFTSGINKRFKVNSIELTGAEMVLKGVRR